MPYLVPFLFDEKANYQGFFVVEIKGKRVIVIGGEGPRFSEFFQLARKFSGMFRLRMGFGPLQSKSFAEAVGEVLQRSPDLKRDQVHFVSDTDPLFEEIIDFLRSEIMRATSKPEVRGK